jgi:Icc-related predicted phosphoesterase
MRLLVIADDDSFIKTLTNELADVLISCGDLDDRIILQAAQVAQCSRFFAVKGNHDGAGSFPSPIFDLHLRTESFGGITFGGFRGSWRYKPRGHFLYDEEEVANLIAAFPPVDVFVAHNSPRRVHDREDEVHLGFEVFGGYIRRVQPKFFFHGHQHVSQETRVGETRVIGVYGQKTFDIQTVVVQPSDCNETL